MDTTTSSAVTVSGAASEGRSVGTFGVVDYIIFSLLFLVSAAIGIYFAVVDRRKKSSENYLLAGR